MKEIKLSSLAKNIFLGILTTIMVFFFTACAQKLTFLNSSVVPAARGTVKVKKDNNKNYVIEIEIQNLAEVERLQPAKQTYVVWVESDKEITKNIGKINSSSGNFSNKLKASFKSVSTMKPTKVFITAENDADIQYPQGEVALSTAKF